MSDPLEDWLRSNVKDTVKFEAIETFLEMVDAKEEQAWNDGYEEAISFCVKDLRNIISDMENRNR